MKAKKMTVAGQEFSPSDRDIGARLAWKIARRLRVADWEHEWLEQGQNWKICKAAWAQEQKELADLRAMA